MAEMQPPSQPAPPAQPHRGVMVLIFGIVSLACACFIFGVLAWVFGNQDLKAMDEGRMDETGRGLTQTGRILGIIGTFWSVLVIVGYALYTVFMVHAVMSGKIPMPPMPR